MSKLDKPLIQRFVQQKIRNPNLLLSLLNFKQMIQRSKEKIKHQQQRLTQLKHIVYQKQQQYKFDTGQNNKNMQLIKLTQQIEDQINKIRDKEKQMIVQREKRVKYIEQQIEKWKKMFHQEYKEGEKKVKVIKQDIVLKNIEKINLNKERIEKQKKLGRRQQKQLYLKNIKHNNNILKIKMIQQKQRFQKINQKQIQQLKKYNQNMKNKLGLQGQDKQKRLQKLKQFVAQIQQILNNGQLKDIYDISIKYMTDYQLSQEQIRRKHQSSQTKDQQDAQIHFHNSQLLKMEKQNPQLKSNKLDINKLKQITQNTKNIKQSIEQAKDQRIQFQSNINVLDQNISKLIKQQEQLERFIIDLRTKLNKKQSQIMTLGILRLAQTKKK